MKKKVKKMPSITLFLLSVVFMSTQCALINECPDLEDIYPCYCDLEDDDPTVHCNHFSEPKQIYDSAAGFKGHRVYQASFFMNWILDPVKPDAFKDAPIERIVFENSTITLQSPQFQGMENHLTSIHMRACFNKTNPLGTWSLGHLKKLRELTFDKNRLVTLPNDWLDSVPDSLRALTVEENSIVSLGDEVFAKAKRLTFLILDDNRLIELKRSMFPKPAADLRSLSLNNNKLRTLPADLYTDMPNLRNIEITNNRLTTLQAAVWTDAFSMVSKLDLSDNPLECDRSIKWMIDIKKPVLFDGYCESPEELKGRTLKSLLISDVS